MRAVALDQAGHVKEHARWPASGPAI